MGNESSDVSGEFRLYLRNICRNDCIRTRTPVFMRQVNSFQRCKRVHRTTAGMDTDSCLMGRDDPRGRVEVNPEFSLYSGLKKYVGKEGSNCL